MGLAPTGVWRSPPYPIVTGGPFPQAKPLPSPPSPSLFHPTPLGSFCKAPGRGGPGWWGGGVLGRKGVEGGGGPPSGTCWGQTHIWGYSTFSVFLVFFFLRVHSLVFLYVFALFSKDFGVRQRGNPRFLRGFLAFLAAEKNRDWGSG